MSTMKEFSMEEVSRHNTSESAWIVIDSIVYDVTRFAKMHPGGEQELLNYAGKDATSIFFMMHRTDVLMKYGPRFQVGTLAGASPTIVKPVNGEPSTVPYAEPSWLRGLPSPYYNESHRRFERAVRKHQDDVAPAMMQLEAMDKGATPEMVKEAGKYGLLACALGPGKHLEGRTLPGGIQPHEFDRFHELILNDQIIRHNLRSFGDGFMGGFIIGCPPILKFGKTERLKEVARECLDGDKRICLAISEPYVGSDVADLRCSATMSPCGKFYIVNGVKKWITGGMFSDYFTTAVRTGGSGAGGVSLLLIERTEGVTTNPIKTMYSPSAGTAYVIFENVKVPVENLIGKEGLGFMYVMYNFNHERWGMVCNTVRYCRLVVEECLKWSNNREVFGKTLIQQPVIRAKLANMIAQTEAMQAWLEAITYQYNNINPKEQGAALAGPIALLKVQSTRVALGIADDAVQIFGGRALTRTGMGRVIEQFQRTIKFSAILGGSEEILADLGVRQAMKSFPNARL